MMTMDIPRLRWPDDKESIAGLSLEEKIWWFASQDPTAMTVIGNTKDFARFWFWCYLFPLRIKRLIYKFKFW